MTAAVGMCLESPGHVHTDAANTLLARLPPVRQLLCYILYIYLGPCPTLSALVTPHTRRVVYTILYFVLMRIRVLVDALAIFFGNPTSHPPAQTARARADVTDAETHVGAVRGGAPAASAASAVSQDAAAETTSLGGARRRAIVQIWDCRTRTYRYPPAMLAMNEYMRTWNEGADAGTPLFEHIVVAHNCPCAGAGAGAPLFEDNGRGDPRATRQAMLKFMLAAGIRVVHTSDIASDDSVVAVAKVRRIEDLGLAFQDPTRGIRAFKAKFWLWNMTEFDQVLYMDHDIVPMKNVARAFREYDAAKTSSACEHPVMMAPDPVSYCYNSGVIVLEPHQPDFHNLLTKLAEPYHNPQAINTTFYSGCRGGAEHTVGKFAAQGDQEVLQLYFQLRQCIMPLNAMYNVMCCG